MSLKKAVELWQSLAFRLTLWYAAVFSISMLAAFLVFYFLVASILHERRNQDLLSDIQEYSSLLASKGLEGLKTAIVWEAESDGVENLFCRILSLDGEEIASSNMAPWGSVTISEQALQRLRNTEEHVFETINVPGHEYPTRIVYGTIGQNKILQIGESLEEDAEFLEILRKIFAPVMVSVTFFAALIGWFMARHAMSGVEEVTETAMQISQGAFDKRVPIKSRGDEIERLARTFNAMVDRINVLIREIRGMGDSIAHDLRSPLARIRGAAEITLTTDASIEEYRAMASNTVEECDRLLGIINTMMDIAEAESGIMRLSFEEVDLVDMIDGACELFQPVAEDKNVKLKKELPNRCIVHGDSRKLQRMISNLLDNALKYTPPGGNIMVSVNLNDDGVAIDISDTGIGISSDDLTRIFKPFYRCDRSRSQHGSGLGLSLVRAIVLAHGGDIKVKSSPGMGSTFSIFLPTPSHSKYGMVRPAGPGVFSSSDYSS